MIAEITAVALICSATRVIPLLGVADGKPSIAHLRIYADGSVLAEGFPGIRAAGILRAKIAEKTVIVSGAATVDGLETWANLDINPQNYSLNWLIYDHQSNDGRWTAATIVPAKCKPATNVVEATQ
jgi:hypothetical protein